MSDHETPSQDDIDWEPLAAEVWEEHGYDGMPGQSHDYDDLPDDLKAGYRRAAREIVRLYLAQQQEGRTST